MRATRIWRWIDRPGWPGSRWAWMLLGTALAIGLSSGFACAGTTPAPATAIAQAGGASAAKEPVAWADVTAVSAEGEPGAYTFTITVLSPDKGCIQYADWWEVVSAGGELLFRRVLLHSHADEQPFTRSGGPVDVRPDDTVMVRAHLSTTGYGGESLRGSVSTGFEVAALPEGFASNLERLDPQPPPCAF